MLAMFPRRARLPGRSFFLFGPRGTGKTTWLRSVLPKGLPAIMGVQVAVWALGWAPGCYDMASEPPEPRPGRFDDRDEDGAPDAIQNDPVLDDHWVGDHPGDHDADGLTDDVDVDDDNDWILDDAAPADLVAAVRPIAAAECEAVASCCSGGWLAVSLEHCAVEATGRLVLALAQGWADGVLTVDPVGLEGCLAAQTLACDAPETRIVPHGCGRYLVGSQSVRGACQRSAECSTGSFCTGDALPAEGVAALGPGPYQVELWEQPPADPVCLPFSEEGEACGPQSGRLCGEGLHCQRSDALSSCVVTIAAGGACSVFGTVERADDCGQGLFCDDLGGAGHCRPKGTGGAACQEDRECLSESCDVRAEACGEAVPVFDFCAEGDSYR